MLQNFNLELALIIEVCVWFFFLLLLLDSWLALMEGFFYICSYWSFYCLSEVSYRCIYLIHWLKALAYVFFRVVPFERKVTSNVPGLWEKMLLPCWCFCKKYFFMCLSSLRTHARSPAYASISCTIGKWLCSGREGFVMEVLGAIGWSWRLSVKEW